MAVPSVSAMAGVVALVVFTVGLKISLAQDDDPCKTHEILDDRWRNPEADAALDHCDDFSEGWYALKVNEQPAEIPKLCLQDSTCGFKVPLHVELEGQSTPQVGENVTAWLCGSYNVLGFVDCCVQRQSVTIKRCTQDAYIYWLKPQRICSVGVCAAPLGSVIPGHYMAKSGDTPRSLSFDPSPNGTTVTTTDFTFPEICPEGLPMCPDRTCGPCPLTAAPTSPAPTPPPSSATPQEIERTLGTVVVGTNPSPPTPVLMDNSTMLSPSSPVPGDSQAVNASSAHSNMSAVFSPNDTLDGSEAAKSSLNDTVPFNTSSSDHMSGGNTTKGMPGMDHPSEVGVDNETSTADDNMASLSNNLTSGHNASDAKSESPEDATSPEIKPSLGSLETTMALSTASSDVKNVSTAAGFPTPDGGPASSSPGLGSSSPGSGGAMFTAVPVSVPPISEAVRFVLNGTFEEAEFRDTLLSFVNNVSQQLTAGPPQEQGLHNVTLLAQTSLSQHITVVDVLVDDPTTNGTIPAQRFVRIIENDKFAEILLSQAGQTILYVCPSVDRCEDKVAPGYGDAHDDPGHLSLFDRNRGIFIAVIAVAACCLLALLVGLLLVRYRRRGVWVLAPDQEEKGAEPLAVENPMTDHQILNGEGRESETTLTINGDHHTYATTSSPPGNGAQDNGHHDIPAADEDNGWVVPLDQAPPPASHGLADKTEDTQF